MEEKGCTDGHFVYDFTVPCMNFSLNLVKVDESVSPHRQMSGVGIGKSEFLEVTHPIYARVALVMFECQRFVMHGY